MKPLTKLIGIGALGFVGLGLTYRLHCPIVKYPGDWEGKINNEEVLLKRDSDLTVLEIINTFPGKTSRYFTSYHDDDNDGEVDFYISKFVDPIASQKNTREGLIVTKEDQKIYNEYLTKIAEIKSEKQGENKK